MHEYEHLPGYDYKSVLRKWKWNFVTLTKKYFRNIYKKSIVKQVEYNNFY